MSTRTTIPGDAIRGTSRPIALCLIAALALGGASACGSADHGGAAAPAAVASPAAPTASAKRSHRAVLAALLEFENRSRAQTDFASLPPHDRASGPNPYRIAALPDRNGFVGLLHGRDRTVLLGSDGRELASATAPNRPRAMTIAGDGTIWVAGEIESALARYTAVDNQLRREADLPLDEVRAIRALAPGPTGSLYAIEEQLGRLLLVDTSSGRYRELGRCHGPVDVRVEGSVLMTNCLLDHALEFRVIGSDGVPSTALLARIQHDGPIWSAAALAAPGGSGLLVAAAGVEDHPLDRSDGSFGYIDSYLYLYRVEPAGSARRLAEVNLSAIGVITPKWIALSAAADAVIAHTVGYGGDVIASLRWTDGAFETPRIQTAAAPPGLSQIASGPSTRVGADPLFDSWVVFDADGYHALPVVDTASAPARSTEARIGEALFFTRLMAPWNRSDGHLSRFTCEACHFEGYVDGRVHYTGRGEVHAATKPLFGLFNNRPHFSRALDRNMTRMVDAEFRVANKKSGRDPWFTVSADEVPWIRQLGGPDSLPPEYLRRAFMRFLMEFSHAPNPAARGRREFSALERSGATVFRRHCAGCHSPRTVVDDPKTEIAFAEWAAHIFSETGGIAWASAEYRKTGVEPYVHEQGARPPSLRRLYKKWPYFTNGSVDRIEDVLSRFATRGFETFHESAPADATRLSEADRRALAAFLRLL